MGTKTIAASRSASRAKALDVWNDTDDLLTEAGFACEYPDDEDVLDGKFSGPWFYKRDGVTVAVTLFEGTTLNLDGAVVRFDANVPARVVLAAAESYGG